MTGLQLDERRDDVPRRQADSNDDGINIRWPFVFQILGYLLGLFVIYNALTNRMTAVEVKGDAMRSDLAEVKADVKTLLRRTP